MTCDRPSMYLSRQYVRGHAHGRRGFKVRLPQVYFDSIATTMEMVGCGTRAVPGRRKAGPTAGCVGWSERSLAVHSWSWTTGSSRSTVPEIAHAVKDLSRQSAKPTESDMHDLKQCVRYLGHSEYKTNLTRVMRWQRSMSTQMQTGQETRGR